MPLNDNEGYVSMLLWLANYLSAFEPSFAVFQYLTLRSILGVLTALITALFIGPWMIRSFRDAPDRSVGPTRWARITSLEAGNAHDGSVLILICITASTLLMGDSSQRIRVDYFTGHAGVWCHWLG